MCRVLGASIGPLSKKCHTSRLLLDFDFLMKITRCLSTVKGCVPVVSVPGVTFDRRPIRSQQKLLEIPGDVSSAHLSELASILSM
jgi:hypothetical protein